MNAWRLVAVVMVGACGAGCHPRIAAGTPTEVPLHCLGSPAIPVTWTRAPHDPRLDQWCAQVGPPVVTTAPSGPLLRVSHMLVISWNVHVGGARILELVEWLRRRAAGRNPGVVLLLQETYRTGGDIRAPIPGGGIPGAIRPFRPGLDVDALGRYLGMSVAYVPSMRNGNLENPDDWEDRGTAVLSTEPISDIRAIELPFGRQRRVAIVATITPSGSRSFRAVAAHLDAFIDTAGQRRQAESLAQHLERLKEETGGPIVMGVDTNARRGSRDRTVQTLARALPLVDECSNGPTTHLRFRFDFLFSAIERSAIESCETLPREYGSDHHPLSLTMRTTPSPAH